MLDTSLASAHADARRARRRRAEARVEDATRLLSLGCIERLERMQETLRPYREGLVAEGSLSTPLFEHKERLEVEVERIEAVVRELPKARHKDGAAIRRALTFLKGFGRIGALDFDSVPIEERPRLIAILALEYRWCFAAAGTTARAFKIAIGRTGAR
ncbi:MAG: hypothetical protein HYV07_17760 [Deltaproteobacteria bacterium]|nr:hypothetical protein [Deltaproteobacteria bacterium]